MVFNLNIRAQLSLVYLHVISNSSQRLAEKTCQVQVPEKPMVLKIGRSLSTPGGA